MSKILKLFISAEKLAKWASGGIAEAINKSQKQEVISKYAKLGQEIVEVQKYITDVLEDGKVDDEEAEVLEEKLLPAMKKLMELIK